MKEISAIIQPFPLDDLLMALHDIPQTPGITGDGQIWSRCVEESELIRMPLPGGPE